MLPRLITQVDGTFCLIKLPLPLSWKRLEFLPLLRGCPTSLQSSAPVNWCTFPCNKHEDRDHWLTAEPWKPYTPPASVIFGLCWPSCALIIE